MDSPADHGKRNPSRRQCQPSEPRDDHRHVRIPIALLDDPECTPNRIAVYAALARHANRHRQCWPSLTTITTEARLHRRTTLRCLAWLDESWYISRKKRNTRDGRTSTLYTLLPPKIIQFPAPGDTSASE